MSFNFPRCCYALKHPIELVNGGEEMLLVGRLPLPQGGINLYKMDSAAGTTAPVLSSSASGALLFRQTDTSSRPSTLTASTTVLLQQKKVPTHV